MEDYNNMISLRFHLESPFSGEMSFTGIPLRAAFLDLLRNYDKSLSHKVHNSNHIRTYSLDPFPFSNNFQTFFKEGDEISFGINLFATNKVEELLRNIAINPENQLRIHHHQFPIQRIDFTRYHPSSLMESWINKVKDNSNNHNCVLIKFRTPTQLSKYGCNQACLFPTPEKVFATVLRVWNIVDQATKLEIVSEYRTWVERNVFVSYHDIHTVKIPLGRKRVLVGFIGNVMYNIDNSSDILASLTIGLSKFAELSNIGKNRTAGLGKVSVKITNGYVHNNGGD
jgi:CRISPR/Cas system endoribonuclease Cas6 (RAMP superfamily)